MQVNLNVSGGRPPSQPDLHHSLDAAQINTTQNVTEFSVRYFVGSSENFHWKMVPARTSIGKSFQLILGVFFKERVHCVVMGPYGFDCHT